MKWQGEFEHNEKDFRHRTGSWVTRIQFVPELDDQGKDEGCFV
jgi:hypothetical protein